MPLTPPLTPTLCPRRGEGVFLLVPKLQLANTMFRPSSGLGTSCHPFLKGGARGQLPVPGSQLPAAGAQVSGLRSQRAGGTKMSGGHRPPEKVRQVIEVNEAFSGAGFQPVQP
jgi:hypothetical protein